jgi:hypothetical protein
LFLPLARPLRRLFVLVLFVLFALRRRLRHNEGRI